MTDVDVAVRTAEENGEEEDVDVDRDLSDEEVVRRALLSFEIVDSNIHAPGREVRGSRRDVQPCDCSYVHGQDPVSDACGPDCINRVLFMECPKRDCPVGQYCSNRRFQNKEYAKVELVRTPRKGCGLRTLTDLAAGSFIMEYCGEVLTHKAFAARKKKYSRENKRHFYFMSLNADEVIDATMRGTLSRFINHSCEPNCETQKWLVDGNLRIGIFTVKPLKKGDELTFDYKFERYGAKAQKCYCGTPSCKGVIGVQKKAPEVAPQAADGDEEEEEWASESDSEDEDDSTTNAMPLRDTDELLPMVRDMVSYSRPEHVFRQVERLNMTTSQPVLSRFLHLQGLMLLNSFLVEHRDNNLVRQSVLELLEKLPITERTQQLVSMEATVKKLLGMVDPSVTDRAQRLLDAWAVLPEVYRIPKQAPTPSAAPSTAAPSSPATPSRVPSRAAASSPSGGPPSSPYGTTRSRDREWDRDQDRDRDRDRDRWSSQSYGGGSAASGNSGSFAQSSNYAPTSGQLQPIGGQMQPMGSQMQPINSQSSSSSSAYPSTSSYPQSSAYPSASTYPQSTPAQQGAYQAALVTSSMTSSTPSASALPDDWRAATAPNGSVYYYNVNTRETQWTLPTATPAAAPESAPKRPSEAPSSEAPAKRAKTEKPAKAEKPAEAKHAAEHTEEFRVYRGHVSECVISVMSKYRASMEGDRFKHFARKITHSIMEREFKGGATPTWSKERMEKAVKFTKGYLANLGVIPKKEGGEEKKSKK